MNRILNNSIYSVLVLGLMILSVPAKAQESAGCSFDHSHAQWTTLLKQYVSNGKVDYKGFKQGGMEKLGGYLGTLADVCKEGYGTWSKKQKKAYWINTYNAYTVKLVLDNYPVGSVKDVGSPPGSAWDKKFIPSKRLEGKKLSLNDVENSILRKRFPDARVHFALNCAAVSCPVLRGGAFTAEGLSSMLNKQTKKFLGDSSNNRYDPVTDTLHVSSLFNWYIIDFEKSAGSVKKYVAKYLSPDHDKLVLSSDKTEVVFLDYNWSLNSQ